MVDTKPADSAVAFLTDLQSTGGATYVTETQLRNVGLAALEAGGEGDFLQTTCSMLRYLGSGKGTCSCSVPGIQ